MSNRFWIHLLNLRIELFLSVLIFINSIYYQFYIYFINFRLEFLIKICFTIEKDGIDEKKLNSLYEDPPETAKTGAIWHFAGVGYSHFRTDREIWAHLVSFRKSFTGLPVPSSPYFRKRKQYNDKKNVFEHSRTSGARAALKFVPGWYQGCWGGFLILRVSRQYFQHRTRF